MPLIDVGSAASSPEGVVILGMHRSGTSLITRLVNLLGLAVCRHDDLLVGRARNPRGHWESKSLLRYNDRLLGELGGSWFCPPTLAPQEVSRMLSKHSADALAALQQAHPQRPWVWKDPRTCVLLPFWSAVLAQRVAYVLIVRHPFEVSDSLARRSGCTPLLSVALWERYTRQAMLGGAGRPMMVSTYDGVLADPVAWCERLAAFLGEVGLTTRAVDRPAVDAFVMDELRHSHQSWTELEPGPLISEEQVALARLASGPTAQLQYVPPALPAETPQTASIFTEIATRKPRVKRLVDLPARLVTPPAAVAGADANSTPPVSVIIAGVDVDVQASIRALGDTLPAGSELLVIAAEHVTAANDGRLHDVSLRQIDHDRALSEAGALALGAQAAGGRVVVLTSGRLTRCDSWHDAIGKALEVPQIGGIGPVMRLQAHPELCHFGCTFVDEDLKSSLVIGRGGAETLVPAALLADAHCAFDRALLAAAGGLDPGFSSASAAIAELSVRLWRMGFRCCIVPQVEVWAEAADGDHAEDAAGQLYDRLRLAALHLNPQWLQSLTDRARELPSYELAAERLAGSDVERRRAAIDAVCAFPADRYFERFPLHHASDEHEPTPVPRSRIEPLGRLRRRSRLR